MELADIYQPIAGDLTKVNEEINKQLRAEDNLIKEVIEDILFSSGKLLRPALTVFSFLAGNDNAGNKEDVIKVATAIELIHTATLIHDDVIDQTALRRYKMTLPNRWGDKVSVLFGDYLFSRALRLLSELGYPEITNTMVNTINIICEGELKQISRAYDWDLTEADYLSIVKQKTASLFSLACLLGAYLGKVGTGETNALVSYGLNLGIAYQMIDDCLDLIGDESSAGKSLGSDFYKGKVTLPLICLFPTISGESREKLIRLATSPKNREIVFFEVKEILQEYRVMLYCQERIGDYLKRAKTEAAKIDNLEVGRGLSEMANYLLSKIIVYSSSAENVQH